MLTLNLHGHLSLLPENSFLQFCQLPINTWLSTPSTVVIYVLIVVVGGASVTGLYGVGGVVAQYFKFMLGRFITPF